MPGWEWGPILTMNYLYVSSMPYTCSLKYFYTNCSVIALLLAPSHEVINRHFHLWYPIALSSSAARRVSDLCIRGSQPI